MARLTEENVLCDPEQISTSHLPTRDWDILIIGAGPAGCTAAIHLASLGHRVLLMDRAQFPRDKVCGDGLMGDSIRSLERLGLRDILTEHGHPIHRALLVSPARREVAIPVRIITVKRRVLDILLARKAIQSGATFAHGTVAALELEGERLVVARIAGDDSPLRASVVVIATGARISLLKSLGLLDRSLPSGVAVRCYVQSDIDEDRAIFSNESILGPGYGWVLPMGHRVYNVGCGVSYRVRSDRRAHLVKAFETFVAECRPVRDLLQGGQKISPLLGWPLRYGLTGARPVGQGPVVAIGEAIGSTLPFSGEGIGRAMQTGEIAASVVHEAIQSGDPQHLSSLTGRLEERMGPFQRDYQRLEDLVARSWLTELGASLAQRSAMVRHVTSRVVSEELDPFQLLSLRKIARFLLRRPWIEG